MIFLKLGPFGDSIDKFMTKQDSQRPTRGQLERQISQRLQKLYREYLDHSTGKITCQLANNQLTVVIESSLTQTEQLLLKESDAAEVEQIRNNLDDIIRRKLVDIVEEILQLQVVDVMSDTTLETERTGLVIILEENPQKKLTRAKNTEASKKA